MRYKDIFPAEESGQHFDEHEALCKFDKESQTDESYDCPCKCSQPNWDIKEQIKDAEVRKRRLKSWILNHVPEPELKTWFHMSESCSETPEFVDKENLLPLDMTLGVPSCMEDAYLTLFTITKHAFQLIGGDLYSMYIKQEYSNTLHLYNPSEAHHSCYSCLTHHYDLNQQSEEVTVASHVVLTRKCINVPDVLQEDTKFPAGIGKRGPKTQAVLAVPILLDNELCAGVVEICRDFGKPHFTKHDEQLLRKYSKWGELVVRYAKLYEAVKHQTDFNDLLLDVTKSLYTNIVQGKTAEDLSVIDQILNQAKDLINAERCSLFLIDKETDELYAKAFDIGAASDELKSSAIRTPSKKGVIGDTFRTGNVNRIEDVDLDERFNREIDKLTGFKTRNLLCVPIHSDKGIIGVTEMVNKKLERGFSLNDERAFYTLSVFCGLALYTHELENKLNRMMTIREIDTSVLNYYRMCSKDECDVIASLPPMHVSSFQLSRYDFDTWSCTQETQVRLFIGLFQDLFPDFCDRDLLIRFTITVKKNYRKVAYHNWEHAFCVANCMYSILKSNQVMSFSTNEMLALFVGCICHDLDHRGYTNSFMKLTAHPLSAIYSSSIMENHHYEQTLQLLMQEDLNVFAGLNSEDYVKVVALMKHAIIATDLALYFDNRTTLKELHDKNLFDSENREHKQRLRALIMTCCDLCAVTKPWNVQKIVVEHINEEFHNQGDKEKALGFEPLPLMDRDKAETQSAQSQVDFITSVCLPAYKLLSEIMPSTSPMYEGALSNLKNWETVVKCGPDAVVIPSSTAEKPEVTKPPRLRRSKNHSHKKSKNFGKDRFPTHKVSIESISDKRLSLNGGFENRHAKLDTRSRKIPGTETWTNPKKSGPGDSWLNYKKGQITGPMRKYLEPGIAYKEAGAKKTFRKLRHQGTQSTQSSRSALASKPVIRGEDNKTSSITNPAYKYTSIYTKYRQR